MSKWHLALFAAGVAIALYGLYATLVTDEGPGFIFIFGGITITAIAAGIIGKKHTEGPGDARR
ncbi:hypothetical protein [Erythrobacter sp.]|uniref:hypothetical protein n=1 Tax=Erythrobacter sp. TaxID=1042 RepID=UPI002EC1A22F|nr:hypothetical protein [Erythrobacter sp.]